jgi:hypothetical protein
MEFNYDTLGFGWVNYVGIVTRLWAGQPENQRSIPSRNKLILFSNSKTSPGAHPASSTVGTGGKAVGAQS